MEDLVSIIMFSSDKGKYVEDSIKSILAQTYRNWELLFMDDSSKDDTIRRVMKLWDNDKRFKISHMVFKHGSAWVMNSALRVARGKWIAFVNCGDIWEKEKLEKQIDFMKSNHIHFSYTKFKTMNEEQVAGNIAVGGKNMVTRRDLLKCCWLCLPTVMYDAEKIGLIQTNNIQDCNDYAIWLNASKKADCYLLNECLTTQLSARNLFSPFPISRKVVYRYEVYHLEVGMHPILSAIMTIRSLWNGIVKKIKYSETIS